MAEILNFVSRLEHVRYSTKFSVRDICAWYCLRKDGVKNLMPLHVAMTPKGAFVPSKVGFFNKTGAVYSKERLNEKAKAH